ncbi:MAG: DinB family protein [Bacteroidota bacterium]
MEVKPVSTRMYALLVLFDMHTTFYGSALEGITAQDAQNRMGTKANHIAWLAGSLVQERYELANLLGLDLKAAAHELFSAHKGIIDDAVYPSLAAYKADWEKISPILRAALLKATDEELDKIFEFPGWSFPLYEMCTFTIYREANCIGQLALWRRLLGYEGMKYM